MMNRKTLISTASALALLTGAFGVAPVLADQAKDTGTAEAPLDIVRRANDLPGPIGKRAPQTIRVEVETVEVIGKLSDGTTYPYWTFDRMVPGPFMRARVGDSIEMVLKNHKGSSTFHNISLHSTHGLVGKITKAAPGETKSATFKALTPGIYIYHCDVLPAAVHIMNGMYGLILVEPEAGLPPVDREFYVMQGEFYTEQAHGAKGHTTPSLEKMMNETPDYYVFNGAAEALTGKNSLKAKVGETIRIYFGVGGPNKISNFHIVGEIFDNVYQLGDLTTKPLNNVQEVMVPPGGAVAVDVKLDVPGQYKIIDHAQARALRGLVAWLDVEGPAQPHLLREGVSK